MLKQNLLQKQKLHSFSKWNKNEKPTNQPKGNHQFEMETLNNRKLLQLEGQCKITQIKFIRFHYLKSLLLILPLILSIFGLFLLKYYIWFRIKAFYVNQDNPQQATHIYVVGNAGEYEQIVSIQNQSNIQTFIFKKLKYFLNGKKVYPLAFEYWSNYQSYFAHNHIMRGLDKNKQQLKLKELGKNQHLVDTPQYLSYMFNIMSRPFFLIQYMICAMFILQKIPVFAYLLLGSTILTTSINYLLLYFNYAKIKQIAQKTYNVQVLSQGQIKQIKSDELLSGDVLIVHKSMNIACDCILLTGQAYVNQASLTGQSVPVTKMKIDNQSQLQLSNRWLFEGTTIIDCRQQTKAIVINTGYRSRRGRIIRKISNKITNDPQVFKSTVFFFLQTLAVGVIIYIVTLPILLQANISSQFRVYRLMDFIGFSFPPTFPIYFNIAYSLSLYRLRKKQIFGTQPEKTIQGTQLKTICFDKTGTLTQNKLQIQKIYAFSINKHQILNFQDVQRQNRNELIDKFYRIFSTCHSVKKIDDQLKGDQIDLKMFQLTKNQLIQPKDQLIQSKNSQIKVSIMKGQKTLFDVIKINEFQSKNQHMSVIVFDRSSLKYFLFVKGAPQRIHACSINKFHYFDQLLKRVSLNGFRSIGLSYKQILTQQLSLYLTQELPKNLLNPQRKYSLKMIGLVTFQNKLKSDAIQTISKLNISMIQSKIITGDNIYIAIQTANRIGITQIDIQSHKVLVLEGKKQQTLNSIHKIVKYIGRILHFESNQKLQNNNLTLLSEQQVVLTQYELYTQKIAIAIDNDFLTLKPQPLLPETVKVFARVTPENKALIIKKLKNQILCKYLKKSLLQTLIQSRPKIAMVGDGSNDLMALKQADVGFGISQTDASYGSCFCIQNLLSIDHVIRQAKNTSTIIIQCLRYYGSISLLKITCAVLLITQTTYYSAAQLSYFNFTSTLIIPMAICLGHPSNNSAHIRPAGSMLSFQNHLVFWSTFILSSASIMVGYFYFYLSDEFIQNPYPYLSQNGFYTRCHTNTVIWLMVQIPFAFNGFLVYNHGFKFKQPFYHNFTLLFIVLINLTVDVTYFFKTDSIGYYLGLVPISHQKAYALLFISFIFMLLVYSFHFWVQKIFSKSQEALEVYQKSLID